MVIQSGIFKSLIAPDASFVIFFTLHFFNWSQTIRLIHFKGFFKLIIKFVNFGFHIDNWIDVLFGDTPVLSNSLLGKKHNEDWFVLSFHESDRNHRSVVIEEIEQEYFYDE